MGKGKGKWEVWVAALRPGLIIIEFKALRPGRVNFFKGQFAKRLPVPLYAVTSHLCNTRSMRNTRTAPITAFYY